MKEVAGLFMGTVVAGAAVGGGAHIAKQFEPTAKELFKSAAAKGANIDWQAIGKNVHEHPDAKNFVKLAVALAKGNHAAAFAASTRLTNPVQAAVLTRHMAMGNHAGAAQTVARMVTNKMPQLKSIIAEASKTPSKI